MFGGSFEDDNIRVRNHFFNPINNEPLFPGMAPLINTSPDWALEDQGQFTGSLGQEYSYADARQYFFNALTKPQKVDRDKNFGLMFQTLGQVVHHIQDMTQPQHVRIDRHLVVQTFEEHFINLCLISRTVCLTYGSLRSPSLYEKYTEDNRATLPFTGYPSVYSDADRTTFNSPRKFWTNAGKGMAEFTNRNFVSSGTNFDKPELFASPAFDRTKFVDMDVQDICNSTGKPCPQLHGKVRFFGNTVRDEYKNAETYNPYASSYSLFDPDLEKYVDSTSSKNVFTLNRANFQLAHAFLIPRAVGYSAGLINYFFRGKMEITLPDEGVYGVVSHSLENRGKLDDTSSYDGFRKIKLKLKNITPGGMDSNGQQTIEPMVATGKLLAIAKFHRNNCYKPDLSGEYGAPGIDWHGGGCRSEDEEIVVSDEQTVPDGINQEAQPMTFNFQRPIPINASDLYLQVVYRGPLGQETDAVVVATKDVSEPTYIGFYNTLEQYLYGNVNQQLQTFKTYLCDSANPPIEYENCKYRYRYSFYYRFAPARNFDPANAVASFDATVTMEDIAVSRFARAAVLTDTAAPLPIYVLRSSSLDQVVSGEQPVTLNQLDTATNLLTPTPYLKARGVFGTNAVYQTLTDGDASNPLPMNPLEPQFSWIHF